MRNAHVNLSNIFISEIEDLPPDTQEKLYSELLDRDAQHELEEDAAIINWSEEVSYSFNFLQSCINFLNENTYSLFNLYKRLEKTRRFSITFPINNNQINKQN